MSEPPPPIPPPGTARLRRLVALSALAVAAALVVVTLLGARRHEVRLVVALEPAFRANLERVVIEVLDGEGEARVGYADLLSPAGPPAEDPEHTFRLRAGRYRLEFTLYPRGAGVPVHARRSLDVVGEARVAIPLP